MASSDGVKRYMTGSEPILTPSTASASSTARAGRRYVTTAGAGPSVGKYLLLAYLPPEHAVEGTELRGHVHGRAVPGPVAVAGSTPLFDPDDIRMKS